MNPYACCAQSWMSASTRTFRPTKQAAAQPPFTDLTFPDWPLSSTNTTRKTSFGETRTYSQSGRRISPFRAARRQTKTRPTLGDYEKLHDQRGESEAGRAGGCGH